MIRTVGVALVATGVSLGFYGMRASESLSSDLSRFFTGSPTDKSLLLMVGGVAALAGGLFTLLLGTRKQSRPSPAFSPAGSPPGPGNKV